MNDSGTTGTTALSTVDTPALSYTARPSWVPALTAILVGSLSVFLLTTRWYLLAPLPGLGLLTLLIFLRPAMQPLLFYGIVFVIPYGAYRSLPEPLSSIRIHWLLAALLLLAIGISMVRTRRLPTSLRRANLWPWFLAFIIINGLSILWSVESGTSLKGWLLLISGYLFVMLAQVYLDERAFYFTLPRVLIASNSLNSVLALLGVAFSIPYWIDERSERALGASPDPNNMALMIIFGMPFIVLEFIRAGTGRKRMLLLLIFSINAAAVVATYSRGGAMVMVVAMAMIAVEFRREITPRRMGLLVGAAAAGLAFLLVLTPPSYWERQSSIADTEDFAIGRRTSYLIVTGEAFLERPFFGAGIDTFPGIFERSDMAQIFYRKSEPNQRRDPHNTYAGVLVGTGVVGLTLFLTILMLALRNYHRSIRTLLHLAEYDKAQRVKSYRVALLSLLLYLFIFSDPYHKYLLLSLGASMAAMYHARQAQHTLPRQEPP